MIKIENFEVIGWEHAIRGMRNPMNSWAKSDSLHISWTYCDTIEEMRLAELCHGRAPIIKENDHALMEKLVKGGPVHAKFRRMITVYVDITAPLYWWKEFDTYKVGTVANSCSTMHKIHAKEFEIEDFSTEHLFDEDSLGVQVFTLDVFRQIIDALNVARDAYISTKDKRYWWQMIQLLPSSYNQKRTVMLNYEVLANIYEWRKNHKLDEWVEFCHWIESLPYSEIITGNPGTSIFYICDREKCENCNNVDCHHTSDINHAVNFERSGHVYSEKVKTPDICPYWNYKDHSSICMCNGCEEENNGVMVNGDRYCNIHSPDEEEE